MKNIIYQDYSRISKDILKNISNTSRINLRGILNIVKSNSP